MESTFVQTMFLVPLGAVFLIRFVIVRRPVALVWVFLFAAVYVLLFAAFGGDDYHLLFFAFASYSVLRMGGKEEVEGNDQFPPGKSSSDTQNPQPLVAPSKSSDDFDEKHSKKCVDIATLELKHKNIKPDLWEKARNIFESNNIKEVETEYVKLRVKHLKEQFPVTASERIEAMEATLQPLLSDTGSAKPSDGFEEEYPKGRVEIAVLEILCGKTEPDLWEEARVKVESDNPRELELEYVDLRVKQLKNDDRIWRQHEKLRQTRTKYKN